MFSGEYAHQLDEKNRIRIPAKYKAELGDKYVFCKGATKCIYVMPLAAFEKEAEKFSSISLFDEEAQDALSEFMSSFFQPEEDKQGRVLLPPALREYAGIEKNVVTVGSFNKLEIWSEEVREERRKEKTFRERLKILADRTK